MRIAIIILGVVGFLTLAYNWESISPDPKCTPTEGFIIPEGDNDAKKCPSCIHASDITFEEVNSKKHLSLTGNE